tara:strand:+ start:56 stop:253 length:198 start_codon:yes stop_codon:yes gene_type:complete
MVVLEQTKKKKSGKIQTQQTNGKKKNLDILISRMGESQLKTFKQSYKEKLEFGKLVYSSNLKEKP